jgi:Uma2 family endonuclease
MITTRRERIQRFVLDSVPWKSYEAIMRALDGRSIRITYDRGRLELMTTSSEHEFKKSLVARLIQMLTFVLHIAIRTGGSQTFRGKLIKQGLEPDDCFWIQSEARVRRMKEWDIATDPLPDLAIESEVSRRTVNRMGIYAALRVPEVWRLQRNGVLPVHHLRDNGEYEVKDHSRAFPFLPMGEIRRFVDKAGTTDETSLMHEFHDWVRDTLAPKHRSKPRKSGTGRKRNGKKS